MIENITVKKTIDLDLCVSCGVCKSACPNNSIDLAFSQGQYLPQISDDCNGCGKCLEVCPGYEVSFKNLYEFENKKIPENIFIGPLLDSYICYTKDEDIRKRAASGGMITSLIAELLSRGIYKGAYVLPFEKATSTLAKLTYTEDIDKIISSSKSKYLPVSVENVVSEIKDQKFPVIVVGTSCHIQGIKKYCKEKGINCSNVLFLGLFCEKTLNYNLLDYYQWKYAKGKAITRFDYRNKEKDGWPGHTKIVLEDVEEIFIDRKVRMSLKKYFQLHRCLFCIDKLNQLADISFGDCYVKGEESELGQSNILVRTEKGRRALEAVKDKVVLKSVDPTIVANSQKIEEKQQNLNYCYLLADKYNHIIYPDLQQKKGTNINLGDLEKRYSNSCSFIEIGKTTSMFSQIDRFIGKEKVKKACIKLASFIAKKVGVKK